MKKSTKILSLLLVLTLCCSLSGCGMLEELRQTRATMTAEGNIQLYDGTIYRPLPACDNLYATFNEFYQVYLLEEEVPLLLTSVSGETFSKSDNGVFLDAYPTSTGFYYCRSDVYDTVLDFINNGITDGNYCYTYYAFEKETYELFMLTEAQTNAVNQVLSTQTPETLPAAASPDYEYYIDLLICPDNQLFMTDTIDLFQLNGTYYFLEENQEKVLLYEVPENLSGTFETIFKAYIESESYLEDMW